MSHSGHSDSKEEQEMHIKGSGPATLVILKRWECDDTKFCLRAEHFNIFYGCRNLDEFPML